jgi:hypothetical protein
MGTVASSRRGRGNSRTGPRISAAQQPRRKRPTVARSRGPSAHQSLGQGCQRPPGRSRRCAAGRAGLAAATARAGPPCWADRSRPTDQADPLPPSPRHQVWRAPPGRSPVGACARVAARGAARLSAARHRVARPTPAEGCMAMRRAANAPAQQLPSVSMAGRHTTPVLSRREEARGSNPLTSTQPRRSERRRTTSAALTPFLGRAGAAKYPGAAGDLLRTGAGGDPQRHGRMPQVMDGRPSRFGIPGCRPPDTSAEGDHPQRPTLRGGEDEGVRLGRTVLACPTPAASATNQAGTRADQGSAASCIGNFVGSPACPRLP